MPTKKQIAANRANSQKSTGPRSTEGKAASSLNALKHGLYAVDKTVFEEAAADWDRLAAEHYREHRPANCVERSLVDMLVHNAWVIRRARRAQAGLCQSAGRKFLHDFADETQFFRLQTIIDSCERNFQRTLKALRRQGSSIAPQTTEDKFTSAPNGFVWHNPLRALNPQPNRAGTAAPVPIDRPRTRNLQTARPPATIPAGRPSITI